jgi:SWI/SNF-related matrix-associated actin-dependent regulator of chromatin subfamily A member 5
VNGTVNGKGKREPEDDENDEDSVLGMAPAKKKSKNGVKVCLIANLDCQITNHPLEQSP